MAFDLLGPIWTYFDHIFSTPRPQSLLGTIGRIDRLNRSGAVASRVAILIHAIHNNNLPTAASNAHPRDAFTVAIDFEGRRMGMGFETRRVVALRWASSDIRLAGVRGIRRERWQHQRDKL